MKANMKGNIMQICQTQTKMITVEAELTSQMMEQKQDMFDPGSSPSSLDCCSNSFPQMLSLLEAVTPVFKL